MTIKTILSLLLHLLLSIFVRIRKCSALANLSSNSSSSSSSSSSTNNNNNNNNNTNKGYRVCTSTPCCTNGSKLLLDALQLLATPETTIRQDACLGGCGSSHTVIRPMGVLNARRSQLHLMVNESTALTTAATMLRQIGSLDHDQWNRVSSQLAAAADAPAGWRILPNCQYAAEICQQCGVGLQLYRGNCAKCGKYPY